MKKIIHKLKKNRLVSKIAALLTIFMILVSSFTVSSFAADEEEATNSITDVWTGVTDSIMSLLGTAQGVFYGSSGTVVLQLGEPISTPIAPIYPVLNFPNCSIGDVFQIALPGSDGTILTVDLYILGPEDFSNNNFEFSMVACVLDVNDDFSPVLYHDFSFEDFSSSGWVATIQGLNGVAISSNSLELTFLGTLAVVAVAISLIMLLVYVISRFLRLRG